MARLGTAGTLTQIALIAQLRLRLFRNSLGTVSAKFDLAAKIAISVLVAIFALGIGLGLGVVAYQAAARNRPGALTTLLWIVFLVWQFLPLMVAVSGTTFDFRNLLRFPLRFSTFFFLSLMYALFDPVALSACFWMAAVGFGIALARPDLLPWVCVILGGLAATSLLLNRLVFSWLERLLARRRSREIFFLVFMLSMFGLQMFGALGERWGKQLAPYSGKVMPVVRALPPGLAGTATTHAFAGRAAGTASAAALLGAYIVAFGFFLRVRLKAQYRGEDLSEAEAPKPAARLTADEVSGAGAARWAAWLPPAVGAIAEKELRYMLRNMPVIMNLVIPFFLIIFLGLTFDSPRSKSDMDFFRQSPELLFPSAVAYSLLVLSHFANNVFAFDSRGIQMLIVAPVRFRDVLLAKNLMLGLVILLEALGVYVLVSALMGAQNPIVAVVTFAALPFILLSQFVVGNLLSLHYPRRFDFGQFRQRQSGISVLLGLLTQIVVMGIVGAIFVTARFFDRLWIAGVAYVLLGAAMLQVYVLALEHAERLAASRRETLVGELCHD